MFNHSLQPAFILDDKRQSTKLEWEKLYPEYPFGLPDDNCDVISAFNEIHDIEKISSIKYDVIINEALQQFSFYYQVSLPYYEDSLFLKKSVKRYKMFLELKKSCCPDESIVPCFDIELIWQAHRLHPIDYAKDCQKIPDSPKIFPTTQEFQISFEKTGKLWKEMFRMEYERSGTMYGQTSSDFHSNFPRKDIVTEKLMSFLQVSITPTFYPCLFCSKVLCTALL